MRSWRKVATVREWMTSILNDLKLTIFHIISTPVDSNAQRSAYRFLSSSFFVSIQTCLSPPPALYLQTRTESTDSYTCYCSHFDFGFSIGTRPSIVHGGVDCNNTSRESHCKQSRVCHKCVHCDATSRVSGQYRTRARTMCRDSTDPVVFRH